MLKAVESLETQTLWHLYMTLLKAENGFQILKGTLGMRPNYHQTENRVEGHIFITILAYHLLQWVRNKVEQRNDMRDWKTIRRLLCTYSLVNIRLPLKNGSTISIRKPSVPVAGQEQIYQNLGVDWKGTFPPVRTEMKDTSTL